MNFGMNHAPCAVSIAWPTNTQSNALPLYILRLPLSITKQSNKQGANLIYINRVNPVFCNNTHWLHIPRIPGLRSHIQHYSPRPTDQAPTWCWTHSPQSCIHTRSACSHSPSSYWHPGRLVADRKLGLKKWNCRYMFMLFICVHRSLFWTDVPHAKEY